MIPNSVQKDVWKILNSLNSWNTKTAIIYAFDHNGKEVTEGVYRFRLDVPQLLKETWDGYVMLHRKVFRVLDFSNFKGEVK